MVHLFSDPFPHQLARSRPSEFPGAPLLSLHSAPPNNWRTEVKRIIDIAVATIALIILAPLLALTALLIKLDSPGTVLFIQERVGFNKRRFRMFKFRSMVRNVSDQRVDPEAQDEARIAPVGRFLRRTMLDELPVLWNVLLGDMSLVGPRPHAVAHNEEYRKLIKGYMVRHKVLPGITGLAQVNGCRGETTQLQEMEARVNYDLDYLRHWSPMLDFKIILLTIVKVFRDEKAY